MRKLRKQLELEQVNLTRYKAEIIKAIDGDSRFTPEDLSELLAETKQRISEFQELVSRAVSKLETKKIELAEMEVLQQYVPVWREVFVKASDEKKKMMLSTVINSIHVHRDRVEIDFKLRIGQFVGAMGYESNKDTHSILSNGRVLSHSSLAANA